MQNEASGNSFIIACVLRAAGVLFAVPLPSNVMCRCGQHKPNFIYENKENRLAVWILIGCLHLFSTLKMGAVPSFVTLVTFYKTTQRHIAENRENIKSYMLCFCW
jgi:hypothetical protein